MASADDFLTGKQSADDFLGGGKPKAPREMVPSYDPMGAFTGGMEQAAPKPTMPYGEQMYNVGQYAKGFGTGMAASIPGTVGDIETLGRAGARYFGADIDPQSFFPTTERISEAVMGPAETKAEEAGRGMGPYASPFLSSGAIKPLLKRGAVELVGPTTRTTSDLAKRAEQLGFKLEPRQLRADKPYGSPGFAGAAKENQSLANKLVTKETGVEAKEITPKFVGERLKDLGENYNKIFSQPIKADRDLVGALREISEFEARIRPADARVATQVATNITQRFEKAVESLGPTVKAVSVEGKELQRLREELSNIARTSTQGPERYRAGQLIELIDKAITKTNPELGAKLADTNRKYAATAALRDLIESGGIQQGNISLEKLGGYLAQNVYGYGSGTSRHPLMELGSMGRDLNIRARWQGLEAPSETLSALLSKTGRLLSAPLRTQLGRRLQRQEPTLPTVSVPAAGAAAAGRAVEEKE